jgi:hypothetical protein
MIGGNKARNLAIKNNNFSEMISICNDKNNRLIISPGVSTLFNYAFKKNNINITFSTNQTTPGIKLKK